MSLQVIRFMLLLCLVEAFTRAMAPGLREVAKVAVNLVFFVAPIAQTCVPGRGRCVVPVGGGVWCID